VVQPLLPCLKENVNLHESVAHFCSNAVAYDVTAPTGGTPLFEAAGVSMFTPWQREDAH